MKRILSFALVLVMCLGLLAACGEPETTTAPAGSSVEDAKEYLAAMYKSTDGTVVRRDFSVVAVVMIDGVSYNVTWTTDAPDYVTIGAAQNNMVTIDIVEEPAEEVTFKLIGTVTDKDGNTAAATFTRIIEAKKVTGIEFVAAPEVGTAYKFAVAQNNLGKTLYFTGEMSGYYMATSDNPFDAVDVFVEDVEGGQRIYFMAGETKTYIDVVARGEDNPGKVNVVLTEAPTCVYTWDAERKTFVTNTVADNVWYLGCYNTYNTISASNTSYIENLEVIGATQFPAGPYVVEGFMDKQPVFETEEPEQPDEPAKPTAQLPDVKEPAEGTAYKFGVVQVTAGKTLYITGAVDGRYLTTTSDKAAAADVYVEKVEGGYKFYMLVEGAKSYIVVYNNADGKRSVGFDAEGSVFTYKAEVSTWATTFDGKECYVGAYNNFETLSVSDTSYINADNAGISQFPAGFFA